MTSRAILAAMILTATLALPSAADLTLVHEGAGTSTIIVPANASKVATFAAGELQSCLRKISGAEVPIVEEGAAPVDGVRILLGPCEATA
ncbi:MAG: hypothetical protein ACOCX2_15590, partial [Armatimonadota bacterium]